MDLTPQQEQVMAMLRAGAAVWLVPGYGGRACSPSPPRQIVHVSARVIEALWKKRLVRRLKRSRWLVEFKLKEVT